MAGTRTAKLAWTLAVAAAAAAFGAATATAAPGGAPVNTCPPTIEGKLVVGKTVGAGPGCWQNNPTSYGFQWLRCDTQAAQHCVPISGATKQQYTIQDADAGHSLVVLVTASNSSGTSSPVNSKPSELVTLAAPPVFKTKPTITGKAQVGEALVAKVGTFSGGTPAKFAFQWQRCDQNGASCADVAGATAESYGVRSADVGKTMRVRVMASNDYGTASSTSDPTPSIQAIPQPAPAATTTIVASRGATVCCQTVRLSGTVSTHQDGVKVVLLAREDDALAAEPIGQAVTGADGTWRATVRPTVKTTYSAQVGSGPTAGVTVNVRPRVGLGHRGRLWTAKVTGRDSFAGSLVFLQRRVGSHWITVKRAVLNLGSVAHFTVRLPRGTWAVRAYVPTSQTGPGYLSGSSHVMRIRV